MRHVWSLVSGFAIAPLVWFLVAMGQGATQDGFPAGNTPAQLLIGGSMLVGVGLLAGLIGSLRTSPLGAMFVGLVFITASTFMYVDHVRALNLVTTTWKVHNYPVNLATPLTSGVLAFAGGLLLMSIFSASRWRGRNADDDEWNPLPPEHDYYSYR